MAGDFFKHMGPILLTSFNFNLSVDKNLHPLKVWDEIANQIPNFTNFKGAAVEVW